MCRVGLHLLPVSVMILLPFTFITSDTGTKSPESCIFGQLLNVAAVLTGVTVYVRCKQVQEYHRRTARLLLLNKMSLFLGMASALGISMVGNFQETNVIVVHLIGAMLAFGLGTLYCWIQTYLSYKMTPALCSPAMCHFRLMLCTIGTAAFVSTFVAATVASILSGHHHSFVPGEWKPGTKGFTAHIISTGSEWLLSLCMLGYFATYICEFKAITMTAPQVQLLIGHHIPPASQGDFFDPEEILSPDS